MSISAHYSLHFTLHCPLHLTRLHCRRDPLVRQQVEWSVRQETGYKRRAFLVANRWALDTYNTVCF